MADIAPIGVRKAATGVEGFDEVTHGGLPFGRTTLLEGGPGTGKTVFALQSLLHGAQHCKEPGIFVAFEEVSTHILKNMESFGWNLSLANGQGLYFLDAQPDYTIPHVGDFNLCGMLAALDAQVALMGAKRIVFDAIDVVLVRTENSVTVRREIDRLHNWLLTRELTAIITHKYPSAEPSAISGVLDFMRFAIDCTIVLEQTQQNGISRRKMRVVKYRGSGFEEDKVPFVIGDSGIEVGYTRAKASVEESDTNERLSSGIERLDAMLGGGYRRGANILITGVPGTAKTTLAGAFTQAACRRGERVLFVTFDSEGREMISNLDSVNIGLAQHEADGLLRLYSARTFRGNSEVHLMKITKLADTHGARCMVLDPLSALGKAEDDISFSLAERLAAWAKTHRITILCTSLVAGDTPLLESTNIHVSSIADTWLHLSYLIHGGERNRCLTIVKSRGTSHSNQVRELILSDQGVALADVFVEGGEVLTGTLRYEKEREELRKREARTTENHRIRKRQDIDIARIQTQLDLLRSELEWKIEEGTLLDNAAAMDLRESTQTRSEISRLRRGDNPAIPGEAE